MVTHPGIVPLLTTPQLSSPGGRLVAMASGCDWTSSSMTESKARRDAASLRREIKPSFSRRTCFNGQRRGHGSHSPVSVQSEIEEFTQSFNGRLRKIWRDNLTTKNQRIVHITNSYLILHTCACRVRVNPISLSYPFPFVSPLALVPWNRVVSARGENIPLWNETPLGYCYVIIHRR